MKKTPLQEVKERFGNKEELVKALVPLVLREEGTSEADQKARLSTVPNKKLLHLHRVHTELAERFGNREGLVDAICKLQFGENKVDLDYRSKLLKLSSASLIDRHKAMAKH